MTKVGSESDDEASWYYSNEGRAAERAAIVAWLRRQGAEGAAVAGAIERGEHLKHELLGVDQPACPDCDSAAALWCEKHNPL